MRSPTSRARARRGGAWRRLTAATALVTAAALTAGAAPALAAGKPVDTASTTSVMTPAQQLRSDQCRMDAVLGIGGPVERAVAAQALDGTPAQLRAVATNMPGPETALGKAWDADFNATSGINARLQKSNQSWQQYIPMSNPPGYTEASWGTAPDFFDTVGLTAWVNQDYAPVAADLYAETIPVADKAAQDAAVALGNKLYSTGGNSAEQNAWNLLTGNGSLADYPLAADDARMLLQDGGFPTSAPAPGTAAFRIAVESLKARFASCDWRDPGDPNQVLGAEVQQAATEWQHEIASQQAQRDAILSASRSATAALAKASEDLGDLLGRSWQTGRLAAWQRYWTGPGRVGDGPLTFRVQTGGLCLADPGGSTRAGTEPILWSCDGHSDQAWSWDKASGALRNVAAGLCLADPGASKTLGTRPILWRCDSNQEQRWSVTVQGTSVLRNAAAGLCLADPAASTRKGTQVLLWSCDGHSEQKWGTTQDNNGTNTGTDSPNYPDQAVFASVVKGVDVARSAAGPLVADIAQQESVAQADAAKVTAALKQADTVADQEGAPRGRGLLAAQQGAQVALATAAALQAVDKAGTTAYQATLAAGDESSTLQALAVTQAHESKAAFDAAAAQAADQQAKDAAAGAAYQAKAAASAEADAKSQLATAQAGEATAQHAAQQAQADENTAAAQLANAAADQQQAQTDQAQAATDAATAQSDAATASAKQQAAQQAETAAATAKQNAQAQDGAASTARQRAWAAEQKQNASQAEARAADAYAAAESSASDAGTAKAAATQADQAAADATTAATDAQVAANDATSKAADADAAATRAQAAADAADAAAKDAAAQKATADQAVATDNAAAAKAISDSQNAAAAAVNAQQDAATAKAQAAKAHADAAAAKAQAAKAQTTAATAAGYAWATAQDATAASDAAAQVAQPANDAVQLGAPYQDTDSAAGLAVLTAQASKTIAQQQAAAAAARSQAAQQAAQQAAADAASAGADAKAAATSAADAAAQAAAATASAAQAVASADRARQYSEQTQAADAQARQYDDQTAAALATAQADAAQAQGDATAAKNAATAADSDATAAQQAATTAATAAASARQAAAQADKDAAAAAAAAKDAQAQAAQAQTAATTAEEQQDSAALQNGGATGIPHVFAMARITPGEATPVGDCKNILFGHGICVQEFSLTYTVTVDFFYCADLDATATATGCPASETFLIHSNSPVPQTTTFKYTENPNEEGMGLLIQAMWKDFKNDVTQCMAGNATHCVLATITFVPVGKALDGVRVALKIDEVIKASSGFEQGLKLVKDALAAKSIDGVTAAGFRERIAARAAEVARFSRDVDPKLVDKLKNAGVKFSRKDLLWITKMNNGKLAYLETGTADAGLIHVITEHGLEFAENGVPIKDIPDLLRQTLKDGKIVGSQVSKSRGTARPIYEVVYQGVDRRLAITVGDNGFVVGANPA